MAGGRVPPRKRRASPGAAKSREAPARAASAKGPAKEIHRLTDLDQMKVLADPLRIRILELFCEERTTKQVAELLEQPLTRLYHHVSALERVGLIRVARTRQRRGALEKYYLAVARTFSADPRLFSSGKAAQAKEATEGVAAQVLENTSADLRALTERGGDGLEGLVQEGILSYLEVRAGPKELKAIRSRLMRIIESISGSGSEAGPAAAPYRLTIAFFPLIEGRRSR